MIDSSGKSSHQLQPHTRPVFILGRERSGTTLLSRMLGAHSQLSIPFETYYLNRWATQYPELASSDSGAFEKFWPVYIADWRFQTLGLRPEAVKRRIIDRQDFSHRGIFLSLMEEHASQEHKPHWGEKTPYNIYYVDRILSWFPEAQLVWVYRDPRAVVASLQRMPWVQNKSLYHLTCSWLAAMRLMDQWQSHPHLILVKYEHLVTQPQSELKRICRFLKLPYQTQMLSHRQIPGRIDKSYWASWNQAHFETVIGPITQSPVQRWRSQLSNFEVAVVQILAQPYLQVFQYEEVGISPLTQFQAHVYIWLMKVRDLAIFRPQPSFQSQ